MFWSVAGLIALVALLLTGGEWAKISFGLCLLFLFVTIHESVYPE
jgi:hypothetical protein